MECNGGVREVSRTLFPTRGIRDWFTENVTDAVLHRSPGLTILSIRRWNPTATETELDDRLLTGSSLPKATAVQEIELRFRSVPKPLRVVRWVQHAKQASFRSGGILAKNKCFRMLQSIQNVSGQRGIGTSFGWHSFLRPRREPDKGAMSQILRVALPQTLGESFRVPQGLYRRSLVDVMIRNK